MQRRDFLSSVAAFSLAILSMPGWAQQSISVLMEPGPLPERSFGDADAPVTIIEYASLTCGHCRSFHVTTWPALREKYVDTGRVRFIFREFPFDPRATAGFMLARCSGGDKWYATLDLLFRSQEQWAWASDAKGALKSVMGATGMSGEEVERCLKDRSLLNKITAIAKKGKKLGVDSTPTFFVNGRVVKGSMTIEQFSAVLDPLLAKDDR